jgi:uncharacterized protein with GYD domain
VQTYVVLADWTEQGVRAYPDTIRRTEAYTAMVEQFGGRVVNAFWTFGEHDMVAITEVPDAESLTSVLLRSRALGNIRCTALRAFGREEMSGIIAKAAGQQ